jgi:hypothetical protein
MSEVSDWRIRSQATYLKGVVLIRAEWVRPTPDWDHDHCQFCWATFAEADILPDALHEGFVTVGLDHWICPACFDDFKEEFLWRIP